MGAALCLNAIVAVCSVRVSGEQSTTSSFILALANSDWSLAACALPASSNLATQQQVTGAPATWRRADPPCVLILPFLVRLNSVEPCRVVVHTTSVAHEE